MVRRTLVTFLLAALLSIPVGVVAQQDAPRFCDTDRDGRVTDAERAACIDRCDVDKDGRLSDAERARCARAAQDRRAPDGNCRTALQNAVAERESLRANVSQRFERLRQEQEQRVREFGAQNHTEEEWAAFRAELAARRTRFEEAVRNLTDQLEARIGRLEQCAGVAAAGRYAACDSQPGDLERFKRMVERDTKEFAERLRARARAADANGSAERAEIEARVEAAIAHHRRELEEKWHALRDAHARSCLREAVGPREVRELQQDIRADRLACVLRAEGMLDPFLDANGREPANWSEEQRSEFAALRRDAAAARAACEKELHDEWRAEVRERFNASARRDRFGRFDVAGAGTGEGTATGRYVAFDWVRDPLVLTEYTLQGRPVFERFSAGGTIDTPRFDGATITARGGDGSGLRMRVHDNPTGGFEGDCADRSCAIAFPEGTVIDRAPKPEGTTIYNLSIGDMRAVLAIHGEHAWDGTAVTFGGKWRLLVPGENFVFEEVANRHRERISSAVAAGRVLAEVNVVADQDVAAVETIETAPPEADGEPPEVEVDAIATNEGVTVDVSADAASGESIVVNIDTTLLGDDVQADDLVIKYYEVADDGTQTEVDLATATNVADALVSDEATPEVHVEVGEAAVQLVVSNTHFSTKRIFVTTAGESAQPPPPSPTAQPSPTPDATPAPPDDKGAPGPALALVIVGIAALALATRRRR